MLDNKKEIKKWLIEMKIKDFFVNDDLTVDVKGNVNLVDKKLKNLPVQFGRIKGSFYCNNNQLTSLLGCAHTVGQDFRCNNNKLTTLKGCPQEIKGDFFCNINKLKSLEGCPKIVGGGFYCSYNELTSLEFCPQVIGGDFNFSDNKLVSLKISDLPLEVNGNFYFQQDLKLIELESLYNDDGWVICDLSTLKRTLHAFELNESLELNLPNKTKTANNKKVKV